MASPDAIGSAGGGQCADQITIFLKIEQDTIVDICFQAAGCEMAVKCASALAGLAIGKHLDDAAAISGETIAEAMDSLERQYRHVADLACEALENAIWDHVIKAVDNQSQGSPGGSRAM